MPRGKLSKATVEKRAKERALKAAAELLGKSVEELEAETQQVETNQSKLEEAEAAVVYIETKGKGFKKKICRYCKMPFAYLWSSNAITCCSFDCYSKKLAELGLKWDPKREPERRWGSTVPLIVSAPALSEIENLQPNLDGTLEDLLHSIGIE